MKRRSEAARARTGMESALGRLPTSLSALALALGGCIGGDAAEPSARASAALEAGAAGAESCATNPAGCTAVMLAAGTSAHTIVSKADGTVWAWGANGDGQLGDGTTGTGAASPVQVLGLSGVVAVAAGEFHSLALKGDGTVWAWGRNSEGQLGNPGSPQSSPAKVSSLAGVAAIAAGQYHSVALKGDGTVWAWGKNDKGQLGDGSTSLRTSPVQVTIGAVPLGGVVAIAAGSSHTLALKGDGTVWAWGWNYHGQLGEGGTLPGIDRSSPVQVSSLGGVVALEAGGAHSLARKGDGTLWAWGFNGYGQLGDGTTTSRAVAGKVMDGADPLGDVVAVSGGNNHTLAIKQDGTLWAWGQSLDGQLGTGSTLEQHMPAQVKDAKAKPLDGVAAVSGGWQHSVALKKNGSLWSWGDNTYDWLGDGTKTDRPSAVQLTGLDLGAECLALPACNALGACVAAPAPDGESCEGGGTCGGGSCLMPCGGDQGDECAAGSYCDAGTCVPATDAGGDAGSGGGGGGSADASATDGGGGGAAMDGGIDVAVPQNDAGAPVTAGGGKACKGAAECASGFCVDGVCCDSACADVCHSCALPTSPGVCAVAPLGVDLRHDCGPRESCLGTCDGSGACIAARSGAQCAPSQCTGRSSGVGPAVCVAAEASCPSASAAPFDCGAYACFGPVGACVSSCKTVDDCADGYVCDESHECIAAEAPSATDDGGCGCRTAGGGAGGRAGPVLALLAGAAAWGRRRRRAVPHGGLESC